ncbi:alpha-ribazole phosphatase family protein [Salaquimonas pukyongi]|uniref:alpha-ribazole phosphatase family protein n=1 Tax=Salaquimonas pukyongi TaxID=2712698 RepID=UPI0012EB2B6C|nr:alpha-ribazole phosphatase family protein [Salaquimonas pukyongi]
MIFLRHPTPDIEPGICYGRTDLDIAEIGHTQVEQALQTTPKLSRIVASPARRCRKLALALAERDGLEPIFDERLWEMHMGEWEGIPWKEIDRALTEAWLNDPVNNPTPGGESFADLQTRVAEATAELDDHLALATAVVCHAGPIRATQMNWHGLTFHDAFSEAPPYAEPLRLLKPGWREPKA